MISPLSFQLFFHFLLTTIGKSQSWLHQSDRLRPEPDRKLPHLVEAFGPHCFHELGIASGVRGKLVAIEGAGCFKSPAFQYKRKDTSIEDQGPSTSAGLHENVVRVSWASCSFTLATLSAEFATQVGLASKHSDRMSSSLGMHRKIPKAARAHLGAVLASEH